jgi:pimeloyl-ACP methyl ester carboxylesterase
MGFRGGWIWRVSLVLKREHVHQRSTERSRMAANIFETSSASLEDLMQTPQHRSCRPTGMHVAEQGEGPLVVLCHGFPESWYSWRHQLKALAEAGYHAVAPDMRGYGRTDAPEAIADYSMLHLVGDMVGLVLALGATRAVVVGHDWGAPVAWHCALLRPDLFTGVAAPACHLRPRTGAPTTTMAHRRREFIGCIRAGGAERELAEACGARCGAVYTASRRTQLAADHHGAAPAASSRA